MIMCNSKLPELQLSCSRTHPSGGRSPLMIGLVILLLLPLSSKIGTMAHQPKRTISEVRFYLFPTKAHPNLSGFTPAPLNSPRGEFPNLYSTPYPLLPSQIGPGGTIAQPFSASFLPTLSPPAGSTDQASPGITSVQYSSPHMRYNNQRHPAPVYYPPRRDTRANRSTTLSPSPPPTRTPSAPSNRWFGSSSSNGAYSSTPPASPVHE
ncbi:hypothetical protein EDB87DRAFT_1638868 [Lactarius vividus]|nr:hypothetical protein EDB87DRAFT_1638868 [Lactarius vividus]